MKKFLPLLIVFACSANLVFATAPANDDCVNAIDVTTTTSTVYTTWGATASSQSSYLPAATDDDVWFKFTTAGHYPSYSIGLVDLADHFGGPTPPPMVIELWASCGDGTYRLAFYGKSLVTTGLTDGTTYLVRVYTDGSDKFADFKIKVMGLDPPGNDDCSGAYALTPVTSCTTGEGPYLTEGATASTQASGDASGKDDDVWFKFTTGTDNLHGVVSLINKVYSGSVSGGSVIELWSDCGAASNIKFAPFATTADLGTLLPNTTYYIRVYTYGTTSWLQSFNICVSLTLAPPDNDSYFNAANFTLNQGLTCNTSVTGATTKGATPDGGTTCNSHTANDIWYKFTAASTNAHIEITSKVLLPGGASSNQQLWMQVYKGSNTVPSIFCSSTGAVNFDGSSPGANLEIGATYYLRIYADDPGNSFTFNLCTQSPPPPVFDECSHAVNIQPSSGDSCANSVQLSNANATASALDGGCLNSVGSDIWLKFTAPDYDNLIVNLTDYQALTGNSSPLFGIAVYSGTCGSLISVGCGLGKSLSLPVLTHGAVYYIRIMVFNPADRGKITVCLRNQGATALNIDCAHAITLTEGAEHSGAFTHASFAGVTPDGSLTGCNGVTFVFNKALWFKFTAAHIKELVDIENVFALNGNRAYIGYKVYTGDGTSSCTGISAGACTNDVASQNNLLTGLTVGSTYFVQVLLNGYNGDDAAFDIRIINSAAPHNNELANADPLIETPVYKLSTATQGTFRLSTLSTLPDGAVDLTYAGDVWYSFIASTTNPTIRVDNNGGVSFIQVYNDGPVVPAIYSSPVPNAVNQLTGLIAGHKYYIRVYNPQPANSLASGSVFHISVYGTPSADAADITPSGSNCVPIDGASVTSTNSRRWLHLTAGGKMVASIFDDATMGNITAGYYINYGSLRETPAHITYLDRNFSITPAVHPPTPVHIIFYFTKEEFERLTGDASSHVDFLNDLTVAAFSGESCSSAISISGETDYGIEDYGNLSSDVYYVEVSMPHFSGFFLKSGFGVTLPVACNNFNYALRQQEVKLNWQTSVEINSSYFAVQRSNNGLDFTTIGTVDAAGTSNTTRYYNYADISAKTAGTYYYRLKQFDKDGTNRLSCGVLKVPVGGGSELFGNVYPNPAVNTITVNLQKPYTGRVNVQVLNILGQVLSQKTIEVNNYTGQISVPAAQLASGTYMLRLITTQGTYTKQFSKAK